MIWEQFDRQLLPTDLRNTQIHNIACFSSKYYSIKQSGQLTELGCFILAQFQLREKSFFKMFLKPV